MPNDFEFALTLNTERHLRIGEIVTTLREVEEMLADIERNVRQIPQSTAKWGWSEDPALRFVASVNGVDEASLRRIVTVAKEGLETAATAARDKINPDWPPEFGVRARASAEAILCLINSLESITVEATGNAPIELGAFDAPQGRRMFSSVDGILEALGRPSANTTYIGLKEWQTGYRVRCYLNRERWRTEISNRNLWENHVTSYGRVLYNADGVPVSITDVTEIVERTGSTKLSELEGKLPDLTGRMSTSGFVRRIRGGDA